MVDAGAPDHAIAHLQRGLETGHTDEFRAAQSIVRKLERDAVLARDVHQRGDVLGEELPP